MNIDIKKIQRSIADYSGNKSVQTGFPSPATHYREPVIDLNKELTSSQDATFYVRIKGNEWKKYNIHNQDVLVVDRALKPTKNRLTLVIIAGDFDIIRFTNNNSNIELWGVITYIIHKAV